MKLFKLPYSESLLFSSKDVSYINSEPQLMDFAKYPFSQEGLNNSLLERRRNYSSDIRSELVEVLNDQYAEMDYPGSSMSLISKLSKKNTFTVCTAHQPCLFTGPLYVIYKIASTIHLASDLEKKHPGTNFIPIFVSGGEDHDLPEINHLHIYGKKISWEPGLSGAVGRMPADGVKELIDQVKTFAGSSPFAEEAIGLLEDALQYTTTYGQFFRKLILQLFIDTDLLVINMDNPLLKRQFVPIMKDELLNNRSKKLVSTTQQRLIDKGYAAQAHARDINLFYFRDNERLRIEKSDKSKTFTLVGTEISFTEEEILYELKSSPEKFSPNVVLRPLYQELILPNIAYVGGGGEIAYWLERREQFEHYGIHYPVLVRRNSVFWLDHIGTKNLQQLDLEAELIFSSDIDGLIKDFIINLAEDEISLEDEKEQLRLIFHAVETKAIQLEKSIIKTIRAEESKHLKSLEHLEHKLLKAKKQQLDVKVNKIRKTHDKLFPSGKPQERFDNFLMYYFRLGPFFIESLIDSLDPLNKEVIVFQEEA
ncbi:MAG: bacillithiol biosynthesis cysteine-adding enzyme BshC [Saprospirales bacterium]|nr:MAG: bacillithiol biosynthesis cysteine-adding enzyme BshC [Saprospirales bacterium]